jgi:probable HAF family extracellular repeat protein
MGPEDSGPESAVAAAATYTIQGLGSLGGPGGFSEAAAINNPGVIVGWTTTRDGRGRAFAWKNGVMTDLGAPVGGGSAATAINNGGVIVGSITTSSGAMRAVRWKDGRRLNLGTLGGRNSQATGINDLGVIAGWSETASGDRHAFVWTNGVMRDIGTLGGARSEALGINRGGAVVGWSRTSSGEGHAFRWKEGVFTDLGAALMPNSQGSAATAINTRGQIVGYHGPARDAEGGELEFLAPFLYHRDVLRGLPTGNDRAMALAVNNNGIVVGTNDSPQGREFGETENAWVWDNGTFQHLPELAEDVDTGARGINLAGDIVGYSINVNGRRRAVVWRRQ